MQEEKTRVDFNAPESLVEEADLVSDLLGVSRTRLLIDGLQKQLTDVENDEGFQRRLRDAYYANRIDVETVARVLGTEEAMRMRLLRSSLDREPPAPAASDVELPSREGFYDGEPPTWTPTVETTGDDDPDSDSGEIDVTPGETDVDSDGTDSGSDGAERRS